MTKEIILASQSPRRRELLSLLLEQFRVIEGSFDESTVPDTLCPSEHVVYSARMKAESVATIHSDAVVVGADTIVVLDDRIMGKPTDPEDAKLMLSSLSGRTHQVYTGLAVMADGVKISAFECTDVVFSNLSEQVIERYVATGEPLDKAGAYGIQGVGCALIERINGCYFNVVGLPVYRLSRLLTHFGVDTFLKGNHT
jgi:septum formation protein